MSSSPRSVRMTEVPSLPEIRSMVSRCDMAVTRVTITEVPACIGIVSGRQLPAGDFDYESGGSGYARRRRTDPRIAARVHAALGDARTVVNVGAGAGSYEPRDRAVTAVEPSAAMRAQRATPALDATAEALPFPDDAFDAAMATVTIHQWPDLDRGLRELRRVARGPVVILTFDGEALARFWLAAYVPEVIATEQRRFPAIDRVAAVLGGDVTVTRVPIPRRLTVASSACGPRWPPGSGTRGTGICARSASTSARCG
jgi:SAM-dependent methyltransferase